ncbi:HIT family protein [Lacisediminimonas sp.]|uniref:HIT family protein n=1 Tax=Lacisediminimonas sp. TaxID=3060582 RepID=UPI00272334EE|nr:HIT family protein [Lacisediminimonas sp.]MDO8298669.1 HIT family protein [Lacisediminimonas sp.]MDO9217420.1 HIT family protein [Lacisediminimonas sp.]
MSTTDAGCELCASPGGELLFQDGQLRVVLVDDADYPGFCRVIWQAHVREMTDLSRPQRAHLMDAVCTLESAVRRVMSPDKINLASLGNMTPHLHWHVIPRYADDAHFPGAVWAARRQKTQQEADADAQSRARRQALLPALRAEIIRQFSSTQE